MRLRRSLCLRRSSRRELEFCIINHSTYIRESRIAFLDPRMNRAGGELLVNLLAEDHSRANESGKHRIVLEGYGYRWYRVGGLDYLLRRTDIDQRDTDAD